MKDEIEHARAHQGRTGELAAEARYARERYDLYKARSYGPRVSSPDRLRKLKQQAELADERLRRAQSYQPPPSRPATHPEVEPEDPDAGDFGPGVGV
jgi:hypothetical protein